MTALRAAAIPAAGTQATRIQAQTPTKRTPAEVMTPVIAMTPPAGHLAAAGVAGAADVAAAVTATAMTARRTAANPVIPPRRAVTIKRPAAMRNTMPEMTTMTLARTTATAHCVAGA